MIKSSTHELSEQGIELPERAASAGMTAVVVDASCFSLPYDYSLCNALGREGCRVILARSEFRVSKWKQPASAFEVWNHFYRRSHQAKPGVFSKAPLKLMKAAEHLKDMRRFIKRLRELQPDIIHFQWLPAPLLDSPFLKELSEIAPLVLTVHNTDPHGSAMQRFHQKLRWASVFRHFNAVVVHSGFSKKKIVEKKWAPAEKIHVIPHGVLDCYVSLGAAEPAPATSKQTIMMFGNIEAYKGLDVLVRAFALIPADIRSRAQLLIVGTPNIDLEPVQKLARELGIDSQIVWKLGFVEDEAVPALFRSASMVVLPYRSIDQSGVLMTAVAFGKAVVASRIGGIPDVISNGVNGILVKPGDPQDLASALQDLLTNPERRHAMEQANTQLASTKLSWSSSARQTIDVYRHLMVAADSSRIVRGLRAE